MITEERVSPDNLVLRVETLEDLDVAWEKMDADPTIVVDGPAEILEAAAFRLGTETLRGAFPKYSRPSEREKMQHRASDGLFFSRSSSSASLNPY